MYNHSLETSSQNKPTMTSNRIFYAIDHCIEDMNLLQLNWKCVIKRIDPIRWLYSWRSSGSYLQWLTCTFRVVVVRSGTEESFDLWKINNNEEEKASHLLPYKTTWPLLSTHRSLGLPSQFAIQCDVVFASERCRIEENRPTVLKGNEITHFLIRTIYSVNCIKKNWIWYNLGPFLETFGVQGSS